MAGSVDRLIQQALDALQPHKASGSDAPGTNSRVDVDAPGQQGTTPASGYGKRDRLGFPQHGVMPRPLPSPAEIARESRRRYPGLATHGRPNPLEPRYNDLYGILRSLDDYDKVPTNSANGSWAVGTGVASVPVTLNEPVPLRLNQFPGALQMHPVILQFSFAQSVAATGVYHVLFTPQGGDSALDLGLYSAADLDKQEAHRWILPASITDIGEGKGSVIGTLVITEIGVTGTPTLYWQFTFGWAFDIPTPAYREPIAMQLSEDYGEHAQHP